MKNGCNFRNGCNVRAANLMQASGVEILNRDEAEKRRCNLGNRKVFKLFGAHEHRCNTKCQREIAFQHL